MKLQCYGPFSLTIQCLFFYFSCACHTQCVGLARVILGLSHIYLFYFPSKVSFYCIDSFHTPETAGESCGNSNDPSKEALAKTEVSLTLTNKFDVPGDENAEMDARTILLK